MKKANWVLRTVLAASFFACGATALSAQACSNMPYLHQNKFDPEPIELSHVQGTAVDQNGSPITQLCVGLFSSQKHELVRYAQSDSKGAFSVDTKGLPDGEYRLVGQLLGFCPANAIIDINSHSQQKKAHRRPHEPARHRQLQHRPAQQEIRFCSASFIRFRRAQTSSLVSALPQASRPLH